MAQFVPATRPANTTLPAVGDRTSSPTDAAMSIPRCPGPNGPARVSNPRTTAPATGIHNGGTGGFRSWLGLDRATGTGLVLLSATAASVDRQGFALLAEYSGGKGDSGRNGR